MYIYDDSDIIMARKLLFTNIIRFVFDIGRFLENVWDDSC